MVDAVAALRLRARAAGLCRAGLVKVPVAGSHITFARAEHRAGSTPFSYPVGLRCSWLPPTVAGRITVYALYAALQLYQLVRARAVYRADYAASCRFRDTVAVTELRARCQFAHVGFPARAAVYRTGFLQLRCLLVTVPGAVGVGLVAFTLYRFSRGLFGAHPSWLPAPDGYARALPAGQHGLITCGHHTQLPLCRIGSVLPPVACRTFTVYVHPVAAPRVLAHGYGHARSDIRSS